MNPSLSLVAPSLEATHAIAAVVAGLSRTGDLIVLAGDMGAGKTAFAQGFGRALGVTEPITSPTFTIVHTYDTLRGALHHADIYRLDQLNELADLALGELSEFAGIVLVEWGDVVSTSLGDHLEVRLELDLAGGGTDVDTESTVRAIVIRPRGRAWAERWGDLTKGLGALDLTGGESC